MECVELNGGQATNPGQFKERGNDHQKMPTSIVTRDTGEVQPSCESLPRGPHVNKTVAQTEGQQVPQTPRQACVSEGNRSRVHRPPLAIETTSASFCCVFVLFSILLFVQQMLMENWQSFRLLERKEYNLKPWKKNRNLIVIRDRWGPSKDR